ncbi:MAG: DUF5121 domain-containing protein [Prevotella sp.]
MKRYLKHITALIIAVPLLAACSDDETTTGSPVITVSTERLAATMGDSIDYSVNCSNSAGIPLSTLKAELCYGGEVVATQTIRTKTEGEYTGRIEAPFYRSIPNGTAELRFTLQDISLATTEKNLEVDIQRPKFKSINFVCADGQTYAMTPTADNPYLFTTTINAPSTVSKGHFVAPAIGSTQEPLTFGWNGKEVALGNESDITFTSENAGDVEISFDIRYFDYGPTYEPKITLIQFAATGETQALNMSQDKLYQFEGAPEMNTDEWYYDPDFLKRNDDGTFTFKAITGSYSFTADFEKKYFRIHPLAENGDPASLQADGSGCIWLIGSEGMNKPTWQAINHGWWTGVDSDVAMAPIGDKKYQVTLTIGKQLNADDVNFKFFGQANWGVEFGKPGADHYLVTDNPYFKVNDKDGNIVIADDATIADGETYVFTIDCSAGMAPATLTVVKQ